MSAATHIERDSLGTVEVPADAYHGIHTAQAMVNYAVTGSARP